MVRYIIRKVVAMIPKMMIISLIIFFGLQLLPGDPITRTFSQETLDMLSDAQIDALREAAGLNDPLMVQYFSWLGRILKGDLGYSITTKSNIAQMLAARLPYTMELAGWALLVASILGISFGFLAAVKQNTLVDYSLTSMSVLGISVPEFFFGIMFILLFSMKLGWLPSGGRTSAEDTAGFASHIKYIIMPVMCLCISFLASLTRYTRGCMLDVMNKDYIKTARSKGISEGAVFFKHGLRNALSPVLTLLIFQLPSLVCGVVVIETVFNYPAVGTMLITAISSADMPTVMITAMIIAIVTLIASTLVDIVAAAMDPRIRLE